MELCCQGAGSAAGGARLAMRRTNETGAMGGGIVSGVVSAHAGLETKESGVIVNEVAQFGICEAADSWGGFLEMSHGMASAAVVQTRLLAAVLCSASMLRSKQRGSRR